MRRAKFAGIGAGLLLIAGAAVLLAQDKPGQPAPQPKKEAQAGEAKRGAEAAKLPNCAVMDEPIDVTVKIMTSDGPVYFCCKDCISKYQKDAAKYKDNVAAQRTAMAKMQRVQVTCPVSGKAVDGKATSTVGGQTVAFCCQNCPAKYEKDPASYKYKLEDCYTYQTRCPVSGEKIDPAAYTDLSTGQRVYLCCAECGGKLLKDPAKYAPKLVEQGVNIDVDKLSAGGRGEKKDEGGKKHP